jgi:tRNA (Thr-GGU) A37 N-methylase
MATIEYRPIGFVECSIDETLRPEEIRGGESRLVLEACFAPAVAALEVGQHLIVVYHLHRVPPRRDEPMRELFIRRVACRPNPIGVTLTRVVALSGSSITVVGLDALNGSPILDIKPYKAIWDEPPVEPFKRTSVIALTGGPGGGKSTLIEDLRQDARWAGRFVALPEAVQYARFVNISPQDKLFQRALVHLHMGLEDGLKRALGPADSRFIVCHRGSLDALAFWLERGWPEEEFFAFTGTTRKDHYRRYAAVIHLVTSADGVPQAYTRWPHAHRPEEPEEAIWLDNWLHEAWRGHPHYYRIGNQGLDWPAKARRVREILEDLFREV